MRIIITESFIAITSNLRPYIGTLRDLGANSTLDGLFVVKKNFFIFLLAKPLHFIKNC